MIHGRHHAWQLPEPTGQRTALRIGCLLVAGASLALLWVAILGGETYRALEAVYYDMPSHDLPPSSFRLRLLVLGMQGLMMVVVSWLLFGIWRSKQERRPDYRNYLFGLGLFVVCGIALMSFVFGCSLEWPSWEVACRLYVSEGPIDASHAVAFGLAGITLGLTARAYHREGMRRVALILAPLAAVGLLAAMEEVSWGQTYLGWQTPDTVAAWNAQHETNVHNLFMFDRLITKAYLVMGSGGFLAMALAIAVRRRFHDHPLAAILPTEPLFWGALWLPLASQVALYTDTEPLESIMAILALSYAVEVWRQRPRPSLLGRPVSSAGSSSSPAT